MGLVIFFITFKSSYFRHGIGYIFHYIQILLFQVSLIWVHGEQFPVPNDLEPFLLIWINLNLNVDK